MFDRKENYVRVDYDVLEQKRKELGFSLDYVNNKLGKGKTYYRSAKNNNRKLPEYVAHKLEIIFNMKRERFTKVESPEANKRENIANLFFEDTSSVKPVKAAVVPQKTTDKTCKPSKTSKGKADPNRRVFVKWDVLEIARRCKKIAMKEISMKIGKNPCFYSQSRLYDTKIQYFTLEDICKILGVDVSDAVMRNSHKKAPMESTRRTRSDKNVSRKKTSNKETKREGLKYIEVKDKKRVSPKPKGQKKVEPETKEDAVTKEILSLKKDILDMKNGLEEIKAALAGISALASIKDISERVGNIETAIEALSLNQTSPQKTVKEKKQPSETKKDVDLQEIKDYFKKHEYRVLEKDFCEKYPSISKKYAKYGLQKITVGYGKNKKQWITMKLAEREAI